MLEAQRSRWPLYVAIGVVAIGIAPAWHAWRHRPLSGLGDLAHQIENEGRVLVVGADDLLRVSSEGATLVSEHDYADLAAMLDGTDERAFTAMITSNGIAGLLVDGRNVVSAAGDATPTIRQRLSAYGAFDTLACTYVTPTAALYEPRTGLVIDPPLDESLAHVARAVLGGARSPRVSSFPEPLRRIRNVEVMVMIEDHGHPRLWRSARGSSIGRALLTATVVARQRWSERQSAMGGAIDVVLPSLDVSVYLLDEDGTLGARDSGFIERVFRDPPGSPQHGVAFDHRGTWRYLLPDATQEEGLGPDGQHSAVRAYRSLFSDSDMEQDSFERDDVRLYRMLARRLALSPGGSTTAPLGLPADWPAAGAQLLP